jgi:SPP1 gp7 family putative phage head morphogenesis protein
MNIVGVRKHINKLYKDVYKNIIKELSAILNPLYQEIYDEALALGFDGDPRDLDEGWIEEFFDEYNPTTKYVFKNEIERKKSYLFEAVVADVGGRHQSYTKAEKYLARQVKQGGIDFEDAVAMQVFEDLGVTKVKWVAEKDYKTCDVCKELDGEIFDIDKAPDKQHHNCRCYLIPVREEE